MSAPTDSSRRGVQAAWPIDSRIHRWTADWCWGVEGDAFLDLLVEHRLAGLMAPAYEAGIV
jgi:hypothetical protein